ncbi:MAG: sugar ABC transporter permease [Anaerolineae bacterium]
MSRRQISLGIKRGLFAGQKGRRLKENLLGYLYILPATIILAAFHFLPVGYAFYISLHNWKIKKVAFLGLANYSQALSDSRFWKSLVVTVYYVIGTVPLTITLSLIIAYFLFQRIKGLSIYRTIYFLPYITSTVASSSAVAMA